MIHTPVLGRRSCAESAPWPPRRWRRPLRSSRRWRARPGRALLPLGPSIGARASALSVSNELAFLRASRQLDAADHGQADDAGRARTRASAADVPAAGLPGRERPRRARNRPRFGSPWRNGAWISGAWFSLRPGHVPAPALLVCANAALDADDARCIQARQAETTSHSAARRFLDQAVTAKAAE